MTFEQRHKASYADAWEEHSLKEETCGIVSNMFKEEQGLGSLNEESNGEKNRWWHISLRAQSRTLWEGEHSTHSGSSHVSICLNKTKSCLHLCLRHFLLGLFSGILCLYNYYEWNLFSSSMFSSWLFLVHKKWLTYGHFLYAST